MIANRLKELEVDRQEIVFDSAEPKSIQELTNLQINVFAAKKGADSIRNSIDILKRYKLNITSNSLDLIKELKTYKWILDKGAYPTQKPIDYNNHLIDALRYVALNKLSNDNNGVYHLV